MDKLMNVLKHPIVISILVLVVCIAGFVAIVRSIPEEQVYSAPAVDRVYGKLDSKVEVISYADLECPACKNYWLNSEVELKNKYQDKVKFTFKHFPLPIHAHAKLAAQAAEAAGYQGKFFEFVDYVYNIQSPTEAEGWNVDKFTEYAKAVGISDTERFKRELSQKYYLKTIEDSVDEGNNKGVDATPTIYINGKKIATYDLETLSNEVDSALAKEYPTQTTVTPTQNP